MHEAEGRVVTGAKDASVVISALQPHGNIDMLHSYMDWHAGVVKCVRWRNATSFASCGNDRYGPEHILQQTCGPGISNARKHGSITLTIMGQVRGACPAQNSTLL